MQRKPGILAELAKPEHILAWCDEQKQMVTRLRELTEFASTVVDFLETNPEMAKAFGMHRPSPAGLRDIVVNIHQDGKPPVQKTVSMRHADGTQSTAVIRESEG